MNWKIIIYALLLVIAFVLGVLVSKVNLFSGGITGNVISNSGVVQDETFTKAICDSKNECADVKISCSNGKVSAVELVSGVTNLGENWKDPRSAEMIQGLCG